MTACGPRWDISPSPPRLQPSRTANCSTRFTAAGASDAQKVLTSSRVLERHPSGRRAPDQSVRFRAVPLQQCAQSLVGRRAAGERRRARSEIRSPRRTMLSACTIRAGWCSGRSRLRGNGAGTRAAGKRGGRDRSNTRMPRRHLVSFVGCHSRLERPDERRSLAGRQLHLPIEDN